MVRQAYQKYLMNEIKYKEMKTQIYFSKIQYHTLFTHATARSDKNSLKHVRETKKIEKKFKLPLLNLSKNLLL